MSTYDSEESEQCSHIAAAESSILTKYKTVLSWGISRYQNGKPSAKRRKIAAPTCGSCQLSLARPFVCLHCSFSGCWNGGHVIEHLKHEEHLFCADVKTGAIFCSSCDDMIHKTAIDRIRLASVIRAEEKHTRFQVSKLPREAFKQWEPSEDEKSLLEGAVTISCQGRRGLVNLGQTCFLNVVLQCFIHNPLLRNYFLGDKHNHKLCKIEDCTCCEMDKLFTEIYSEDSSPFGPINFLATTWRKSSEMAGYAQQDAHEFFISLLNHIHSNCKGHTNISCNCIIHTTFAGQLQSDVKCERCGNVTSTIDPMLDISLELKEKGGEDITLGACLRRYTQPERLGAKEYSCGKCGKASHEASKRLSFRKLPPVLCFQFKRFEHKTSEKSSSASSARKLDSLIRFPSSLNMLSYTTLAMKDNEKENHTQTFLGLDVMYEYDLFAVINHEGQMNNGHYTNFARFNDEWYRFDDEKVTHSTLGACLSSPAYMCFYVKKHLEYKPHVVPTYVRTRETEAVREKEMEREKEAAQAAHNKEVEDALLAMV